MIFIKLLIVIIGLISLIAKWLLLDELGERGWKVIIPFYGYYIFGKMATKDKGLFMFNTFMSIFVGLFYYLYWNTNLLNALYEFVCPILVVFLGCFLYGSEIYTVHKLIREFEISQYIILLPILGMSPIAYIVIEWSYRRNKGKE